MKLVIDDLLYGLKRMYWRTVIKCVGDSFWSIYLAVEIGIGRACRREVCHEVDES